MKITFVVPVLNERDTLEPLVEQIMQHASPHDFRILFIDDGSADGSSDVLDSLHQRFDCVDVIRFRRNFGKSAALAAGFSRVDGDIVITMDADLQDNPKEIPRFIEKIEEGYDVVVGWKRDRQDPWDKTMPSRTYNRVVSRMFRLDLHDINCGYKALRIEVTKSIPLYGEMHRMIVPFAAHLGYRIAEIPVEHLPRRYGVSKYGLERFSRGAIDAATALFLTRYRHTPGHVLGTAGLVSAVMGLAGILLGGVEWLTDSLTAALFFGLAGIGFVLTGLVLAALGLVAELLVNHRAACDLESFISQELLH